MYIWEKEVSWGPTLNYNLTTSQWHNLTTSHDTFHQEYTSSHPKISPQSQQNHPNKILPSLIQFVNPRPQHNSYHTHTSTHQNNWELLSNQVHLAFTTKTFWISSVRCPSRVYFLNQSKPRVSTTFSEISPTFFLPGHLVSIWSPSTNGVGTFDGFSRFLLRFCIVLPDFRRETRFFVGKLVPSAIRIKTTPRLVV